MEKAPCNSHSLAPLKHMWMVCNEIYGKKNVPYNFGMKKKYIFLDSPHPNDGSIGILLINLAYFRNYMQHFSYYIFL